MEEKVMSMRESLLGREEEEEEEKEEGLLRWEVVLEEGKKQAKIAAPMIVVNMLQFMLQVVALMMVGHLGELSLSSAAISSSLASVTGFSVMIGMSSALETLCGQAYGAQQYRQLGIYTQRAIVALLFVCIPISFFWLCMEKLLVFIGQDPMISHEAAKYAVYLIPGLFASAILQPLVKYLQSQSIVLPMSYASVVTLCFHVPLCWVLIFKTGLRNLGGALAVSISYCLNVGILALYVKLAPSCKQTMVPVSKEAFSGIGYFMKLALPSAGMICLEYWSFEILTLLSGLLPNPKLEASVLSICLSTLYLLYAIPYGLSAAASTRIANELGAGSPKAARLAVWVVIVLAFGDIVVVSTTLYCFRYLLGHAYSDEEDVILYVVKMAPLLSLSTCMDGLQGVLSGVARGCGWQHLGAFVNLGAFYLVGIPIAVVLGFVFHLGGKGLWIGILCGASAQTIMLALITGFTDWKQQATKARERVLKNHVTDSSDKS